MVKKEIFRGSATALITPFRDGEIDYDCLGRLIDMQIDAKIDCLVIGGTTAEAATLSDDERYRLFEFSAERIDKKTRLIFGTGTNDTRVAIKHSKFAEKVGCDGLLLVTPYYNKGTEGGIEKHYLSIAESVDLPTLLYNVPSRTGVDIPVSVYKRLCQIPNIIGVKEASTDISKLIEIRNACGNQFSIWTGNDDLTVPAIALGAAGVISVASNICPQEMLLMADAALDGDFDTASEIACELQPLIKLLFAEVNPVMVKEAMKYIGFDCGRCKLPLTQPKKENIEKLNAYFSK